MSSEVKLTLLKKYLPDDVALVGSAYARAIIKGNINFQKSEQSQDIDLISSLQAIAALVVIINNGWAIIDKYKSETSKTPSVEEVKNQILTSHTLPSDIEKNPDQFFKDLVDSKKDETNE